MYILKTACKNILCNRDRKGFTLLEVMISVSIISFVFVSLFRMQSSTIELAAAGKFNSIAPILANQLIGEIETDLAGWSEAQGDFKENFPGLNWTCDISDFSLSGIDSVSDENQSNLKKIQIEIIGPSGSYKVSTWRVINE